MRRVASLSVFVAGIGRPLLGDLSYGCLACFGPEPKLFP